MWTPSRLIQPLVKLRRQGNDWTLLVPYSITSPWAHPAHGQGSWAAAVGTGSCPGTSWGPSGQGDQSTWTPLLPYRPGWSSREKQNRGSGLIHLCGKLSGLDTADGKNVYQEQSSQQATSQSELSPLTRPRWQNTQLRGGKIHQRHCFTSKSQDTKETQSILFKTIIA